jgi:hypothetical protein
MGKSAVAFVVWFCVMGAALFVSAGTLAGAAVGFS